MRIVFFFLSFKDPNLLLWQRWQKRGITAEGGKTVPHWMKILEMWRSCPLLIIISCLLWGRENSHLSLPANQPVSPEQAAECVHSWDRLIKWGRFLTISPGWGTLSSLSPSSTLELLKGTTGPVWCDLVLLFFCGKYKNSRFLFVSRQSRATVSFALMVPCSCVRALLCLLRHEDLWVWTTNQAI